MLDFFMLNFWIALVELTEEHTMLTAKSARDQTMGRPRTD